ncbi:MAG: PKD domain-containing protein [Bacteroidia bacterium]|nr:PKD domain-containing protein [Bacteroidia bacterium]
MLIACEKEQNSPPVAHFVTFPGIADTSSFIKFDGSSSKDLETHMELLQFRWDFNGDGVWETEYRRDPLAIWQYEKTGTYQPEMEVRDEGGLTSIDSVEVIIRLNFIRSTFTDPRDGNLYRMVLIDDKWWMSDNLRYGFAISRDSVPSDNGTVEMFMIDSQKFDKNLYGGYYSWGELTNYQRDMNIGICPPGWRLLTLNDSHSIERFWLSGEGGFYIKPGGYLGLDFLTGGNFSLIDKIFYNVDSTGCLWVNDYVKTDMGSKRRILNFGITGAVLWINEEWEAKYLSQIWKPKWGNKLDFDKLAFNVRCVKNIE